MEEDKEMKLIYSHYDWLEIYLPKFLKELGIDMDQECPGIIGAHGDKAYSCKNTWKENGIEFFHGIAIFFLTYLHPWENECRETENGWIDPYKWVIENKDKFLPIIKKLEKENPPNYNNE
jgi:hypothetical protein